MIHLIKKQLWYVLAFLVLFYGVPLACMIPGPDSAFGTDVLVSMLLMYNPAAILAVSAIYGFKHTFKWYFLLFVPVLFLPSVFIFYNDTAIIYVFLYEIFCLAGLGLGVLLGMGKTKKKTDKEKPEI